MFSVVQKSAVMQKVQPELGGGGVSQRRAHLAGEDDPRFRLLRRFDAFADRSPAGQERLAHHEFFFLLAQILVELHDSEREFVGFIKHDVFTHRSSSGCRSKRRLTRYPMIPTVNWLKRWRQAFSLQPDSSFDAASSTIQSSAP